MLTRLILVGVFFLGLGLGSVFTLLFYPFIEVRRDHEDEHQRQDHR